MTLTEAELQQIRFESLPVQPRDNKPLQYTDEFGKIRTRHNRTYPHTGLDIVAPRGTPVYSVARGRVVGITSRATQGETCGNGIIIEHDVPGQPKYRTGYCHLDTVQVNIGRNVRAGELIGTAGGTVGLGVQPVRPHLHFTLRPVGSERINPSPYLDYLQVQQNRLTLAQASQRTGVSNILRNEVQNSVTSGTGPEPLGITPYIASLKSFHPKIQYELFRRSLASDMVNVHMPYVRLTSLTHVQKENLLAPQPIAWCPSLGIHGMPDMSFEDVYSIRSNQSIIAHAYGRDGVRVPVVVENADSDAPTITPPGIVSMKTERSTAGPMGVRGGLFRATINIRANSVGQLDALLKYFLRPATRVVLEFGRTSSRTRDLDVKPYPWRDKTINEIKDDFQELVKTSGGNNQLQREFINQYVYNNYGNYEILVGYVVNFKVKYVGTENRYDIELTVHSVQQFEVPTTFSGARALCSTVSPLASQGKTTSIADYFAKETGYIEYTFDKLITYVLGRECPVTDPLYKYKEHIVTIGDNTQQQEVMGEKAYFISWEFFINAVLNDERYGMMNVFQLGTADQATLDLIRQSVPKPIDTFVVNDPTTNSNDKLRPHYAGYHRFLRSTNPRVMIISNAIAQASRQVEFDRVARLIADDLRLDVDQKSNIDRVIGSGAVIGHFQPTDGRILEPGYAPLARGVWLNSNIIKECFNSTDTLSAALGLLLTKMNAATMGYWNLQLLSNDTEYPGVHVIDMTISGGTNTRQAPPVLSTTGEFINLSELEDKDEHDPKYLYVFNRKNYKGATDDGGSEATDISIDFGLPQAVAVQAIAGIGGMAARGMMNLIDAEELARLSLFDNLYPSCVNDAPETFTGPNRGPIENQITDFSKSALVVERLGQVFTGRAEERRDERLRNNQKVADYLNAYANDFGLVIRLIEYDTERMVNELNVDAFENPNKPHPFNSSNLTKTLIDVTLPGIAGIQLFQTFNVAKVPTILSDGVYTVVKVEHDFSTDKGWFTKIQGRFRYVPPT